MNDKLKKIEELKQKLNFSKFTEGEKTRLTEEFMIEFTYDSNAIEGSTLSLEETSLVLKEDITIDNKPLKDHLAAKGHKDAYYYIEDLVSKKNSLIESQILNIHSLVLIDKPYDKGKYRNLPVKILGTDAILAQPYMIKPEIENLLNWYSNEDKLNILEKIVLFHLRFETIHPFIDGNGRTGRLILNLELMRNGYLPINIKNKNKKRYYDAFKQYNETKEYSLMLDIIYDYLLEEFNKYNNLI